MVIGPTGRNFAAGMSGGIAYVWDVDGKFKDRCNLEMVGLEEVVEDEDIETVLQLLQNHYRYTGSSVAKSILDDFQNQIKRFVKVMPHEYKRILEQKKLDEELDLTEVSDG